MQGGCVLETLALRDQLARPEDQLVARHGLAPRRSRRRVDPLLARRAEAARDRARRAGPDRPLVERVSGTIPATLLDRNASSAESRSSRSIVSSARTGRESPRARGATSWSCPRGSRRAGAASAVRGLGRGTGSPTSPRSARPQSVSISASSAPRRLASSFACTDSARDVDFTPASGDDGSRRRVATVIRTPRSQQVRRGRCERPRLDRDGPGRVGRDRHPAPLDRTATGGDAHRGIAGRLLTARRGPPRAADRGCRGRSGRRRAAGSRWRPRSRATGRGARAARSPRRAARAASRTRRRRAGTRGP